VSAYDDSIYTALENQLSNLTVLCDDLAARRSQRSDDAELHGKPITEFEERALDLEAEGLLDVVRARANQ